MEVEVQTFLKILKIVIDKSSLEYDILLLSDFIVGMCMNSKYQFPIYDFSEKLREKYQAKYNMGYFSYLLYYEKHNAMDCFFRFAAAEHIAVKSFKPTEVLSQRLVLILSEIIKRPRLYLSGDDIKYVKAFIDGYLAGEDLTCNKELGTSMKEFDVQLGRYLSDRFELYEDREWYEKLRYISMGLQDGIKKLIEFITSENGMVDHLSI